MLTDKNNGIYVQSFPNSWIDSNSNILIILLLDM